MNYQRRMVFLIVLDSLIVISSIYLSFFIIFSDTSIFKSGTAILTTFILLISHLFFAYLFRLYHKAWEYASVQESVVIVQSITLAFVVAIAVQQTSVLLNITNQVYWQVMIQAWMINILFVGASRFSWRILHGRISRSNQYQRRALIIGAGETGTTVVRDLLNMDEQTMKPICYVDDDASMRNLQIHGLPVVGNSSQIVEIVEKYRIDQIIIAIPSLRNEKLRAILEQCTDLKVKTVIIPKMEDVLLGKVSVSAFRDVQPEDLLGRNPIELDINSISGKIDGKTILVTGAGGSIGSEICRQICQFKPKKVIILGHGENSIYDINKELTQCTQNRDSTQCKSDIEIVPVIADVQDYNRLLEVMNEHKPNVVYHAAAHKHVPLMEQNPKESIKNNVIGTKNVATAADAAGVSEFVFISTDKAVNPTNVMGSSKRIAEMVIQELNKSSKTKFVAVRFGNVLGSRGSVIPLFKQQISDGGPVTVTHPEMTRYFMTIPEASKLVIQAGALARGGEIFVLDMGEPVKILDLAKNIIKLSGYTIDEIGIEYSGIRPGEKMFEELLDENEVNTVAVFPKIFIGKTVDFDYSKVTYIIDNFSQLSPNEVKEYVLDLANKKEITVQSSN